MILRPAEGMLLIPVEFTRALNSPAIRQEEAMVTKIHVVALMLAAAIAVPVLGWAQQQPDEESNDVASSERTAVSIQTLTAFTPARVIGMRFDPIFNPRILPGRGPRTAGALPDGFVSLASGEESKGLSVWLNTGLNKIENDFAATAYDGYTTSVALGGDYALTPWATAGLSLNYAHTDIDTPFNGGGSETDGFTLLPYANLTLNEWLSADVSVGYAWNDTDVHREVAGTTVTGSQSSEGWLAVGNLKAQTWLDRLFLSGKVGLLYNQDRRSTFTESDGTVNVGRTNNLTQMNVGASVGYWLEPFMPSLSLTYTRDLDREDEEIAGGGPQPPNDKDGLTIGLGLAYYGSGAWKALSVSLLGTMEVLREDLTNNGLSLNVRYAF
jgi:outer membrane autotransporter protein